LTRRALSRLGASLLLVWLVLTGVFFLLHLLPGDPGTIFEDPRVPRAQRERLRAVYGLDRPLVEQYGRWLRGVASGEWGYSFSQQRPVATILRETLPATLLLSSTAFVLELGLGIGLGMLAAARARSLLDGTIRVLSMALGATPAFWLALLLFLAFAIRIPLFPAGGMRTPGSGPGLLAHLVLPALALGLPAAAAAARFVRATLLEQMAQPFHLSARARGLAPARVFLQHALRPGLAPIVQLAGLSLAALLSGTLAVEVVFAWPGLGRASYDALVARDYPLLLAGTAISTLVVVAGSFLAESLHAALDPRVRDA
jgi:peptide/nickel transport system permease protein